MKKKHRVLPITEYMDKTTAGFLGQLVGFFSGYEFVFKDGKAHVAMPEDWFEVCNGPYANPNPHKTHQDKLLPNPKTGKQECWMDDDYSIDILNLYILRDMYNTYGTLTSKVITDGWAKYNVYDMGGGNRYRGAYALMHGNRYLPEFAGSWEFGNRYSYCYEPCIENETLGMVTAGMPMTAARFSDAFAVATSEQDPVLWTRFLVTMYSLAYFEKDVQTLIRRAQSVLPKHSFTYRVVDRVLEMPAEFPRWQDAVIAAEKEFFLTHDRMVHDTQLEPNVNTSFVLLGLLYGEGDYLETCKIVSLAGYDGDSTAAICMGVAGILYGMHALPEKANELIWQDGEGMIINLPYPESAEMYWMCMLDLPKRMPIREIIDMYRENFERVLIENGGYIEGGNYYIPWEELGSTDSVFYADFNDGKTDGFSWSGELKLIDEGTFEGRYTALLHAGETRKGELWTVFSDLQVGEQYRVVCFCNTSPHAKAELFARAVGEEGVFASVYDTARYIRRTFTFTATAKTMEFGLRVFGDSEQFATIDHITVTHVVETKVAKTEFSSGEQNGKIHITVHGKAEREVMLKVTFANTTGEIVPAAIAVNGEDFNVAPFYKTGETVCTNAVDATYIPVLLSKEENRISLDVGDKTLHILNVEAVCVQDLW